MIVRRLDIVDAYKVWKLAGGFIKTMYKKSGLPGNEGDLKRGMYDFKDWSYGLEVDSRFVGVLAGGVAPLFLVKEPVWYEALFYVDKKYRKHVPEFIRKVQIDLKVRGVKYMTLGMASNSIRLRTVYKKYGYKFLDAHYIKKL